MNPGVPLTLPCAPALEWTYYEIEDTQCMNDSGPPLSNAVIPPCLQQIFRDTWGLAVQRVFGRLDGPSGRPREPRVDLLPGVGHTVLRVGFNITTVDGTSVPDWLGSVIEGDITHVGP